jgi:CheY-specific phosphatase CheX
MGVDSMELSSRVLVYDHETKQMDLLKRFFSSRSLVGLRVGSESRIIDVLNTNIDLGAVFLSGQVAEDIIVSIHRLRSELPIFIRQSEAEPVLVSVPVVPYETGDEDKLDQLVNTYIFNRYYPSDLIRLIAEGTRDVIADVFTGMSVEFEKPYLIRDRIIYGELFSLIRMETDWCRGYMMLQMAEEQAGKLIQRGEVPGIQPTGDELNFRVVNALLSELTNSVWGRLKGSFAPKGTIKEKSKFSSEIPSVINHSRNYISFGTDDPKLCFKYTLHKEGAEHPMVVYQKFAFHLKWEPEAMQAGFEQVNDMVEDGGLVFL